MDLKPILLKASLRAISDWFTLALGAFIIFIGAGIIESIIIALQILIIASRIGIVSAFHGFF